MHKLASALSISRRGKSVDGSSTASFNTSNDPTPSSNAHPRPVPKSRSTALFAKAPKSPLDTTTTHSLTPSYSSASQQRQQPYSHSTLTNRPVLTPASSTSSNESASLRTPDDDGQMTFPSAPPSSFKPPREERKRWSTWFGLRKASDKSVSAHDHAKQLDKGTNKAHTQIHHKDRKLHQQQQQRERTPRESASDTDDDGDSESDDSDDSDAHHRPNSNSILRRAESASASSAARSSTSAPFVITQAALTAAQANLRLSIRSTLITPHCSPPPLVVLPSPSSPSPSSPFLYAPTNSPSNNNSSSNPSVSASRCSPRFPRSISSYPGGAPFKHTFESTLHLRRMMRKLERRHLTHAEARSIAAFSSRDRTSPAAAAPQSTEKSGLGVSLASGNKRLSTITVAATASGTEASVDADEDNTEATAEAFRRVVPFCRGLRVWSQRPCFEARMDVWLPDEGLGVEVGEVVRRKVMGVDRGIAVTDLEFSEGLEVLAGLHLDDVAFEKALLPPPPPPPSKGGPFKPALQKSLPRDPSTMNPNPRRSSSFMSAPSPLRLEHGGPSSPFASQTAQKASGAVPVPTPDLREVRFAEDTKDNEDKDKGRGRVNRVRGRVGFRVGSVGDREWEDSGEGGRDRAREDKGGRDRDMDDDVPLGYALQAKKKREEKERFLQAERDKRGKATEEEQEERKREEERRRQARLEEEERERERKRRLEEERKDKYAEEVIAARQRRDLARAGGERGVRERDSSYSRPTYDYMPPTLTPKRQTSEFGAMEDTQSTAAGGAGFGSSGSRASFYVGSSDDVRKSLVVARHNNGGGPQLASSMEDLHASRPVMSSSSSRRQSSISVSEQQGNGSFSLSRRPISEIDSLNVNARRMSLPRSQTAPTTTITMTAPQVVAVPYPVFVPPVPPMPVWNMGNMGGMAGMNAMNMPLLPPTPPFMMQHYGGGSNGGSSGGGSRSGSPSGGSATNSRSGSRSHSRDSSRRSSGVHFGSNGAGTPPNGSPKMSFSSLPQQAPMQMPQRPRQSFHAGSSPRQSSHLSRDITPDAKPGGSGGGDDQRRYSRLSTSAHPPRQASSSSFTSQTQAQGQARLRKTSQTSSSSRKRTVPPEPKRRTTMM